MYLVQSLDFHEALYSVVQKICKLERIKNIKLVNKLRCCKDQINSLLIPL